LGNILGNIFSRVCAKPRSIKKKTRQERRTSDPSPICGRKIASITGAIVMRTHDRRIGVSENDRRWCFDGFATRRVRTGFALVCCDREVMSWWR
jgi:hypothetical protein